MLAFSMHAWPISPLGCISSGLNCNLGYIHAKFMQAFVQISGDIESERSIYLMELGERHGCILVDPPWSPLARWVTFYSCLSHPPSHPATRVTTSLSRAETLLTILSRLVLALTLLCEIKTPGKIQGRFLNQDQDAKPQSGNSSILLNSKSGLKGHGCSLHFWNQDRELKFRTRVYQRPVII